MDKVVCIIVVGIVSVAIIFGMKSCVDNESKQVALDTSAIVNPKPPTVQQEAADKAIEKKYENATPDPKATQEHDKDEILGMSLKWILLGLLGVWVALVAIVGTLVCGVFRIVNLQYVMKSVTIVVLVLFGVPLLGIWLFCAIKM